MKVDIYGINYVYLNVQKILILSNQNHLIFKHVLVYVRTIEDIILIQVIVVFIHNKIFKMDKKYKIVQNHTDIIKNVLIYVHMELHYNQINVYIQHVLQIYI